MTGSQERRTSRSVSGIPVVSQSQGETERQVRQVRRVHIACALGRHRNLRYRQTIIYVSVSEVGHEVVV